MSIELHPYVQPTRFTVGQGLTLARRLASAAPEGLGERERAALALVEGAAQSLSSVARERLAPDGEAVRPLAARLVSAWLALRDALSANARLTGTEASARAEVLLARVLPNGASVAKLPAVELWPMSETLLQRIAELGVAAEVDELVGARFLAQIRQAHAVFAEAIGVSGAPRPAPSRTAVREASAALAAAIVEYGRRMIGWVDVERPDSVAAFRRAMSPLDEHRQRASGKRGGIEEGTETDVVVGGDEPSPVVVDPLPPAPIA